jgi:hypothetical protein
MGLIRLNEKVTPVGIEPTPFRTGTLNQRLNRSAKASYEKKVFSTLVNNAECLGAKNQQRVVPTVGSREPCSISETMNSLTMNLLSI